MKIKDLIKNNKKDGSEIDLKYTKNENISRLILYTLDTVLLAFLFLFLGLGFSSFINAFLCKTLDRTKSKIFLFFETTGESFAIIFSVFLLLFYIPRIPSIVPFADKNHLKFRTIAKHVILAFSAVMAHDRLLTKYRYLIGVDN